MTVKKQSPQRDSSATRKKILEGAISCFSERGYSSTGTRDIAKAAGVTLILVSRYFGSKAGLFEAALKASLEGQEFLDVPREGFGASLARLILTMDPRRMPISIAALAAGDPEAREIATRIVKEYVTTPLEQWVGGETARDKAVAISVLGVGLVTHLYTLPIIDRVESLGLDHPLVRWFTRSCQQIVDDHQEW